MLVFQAWATCGINRLKRCPRFAGFLLGSEPLLRMLCFQLYPRTSRLRDRAAMAGKGTVRNYDGDGNGNVKKAIGLMSKTTTLHVHHAFL